MRDSIHVRWLITIALVGLAFLFGFDAGKHQGRAEGKLEQIQFQNDLTKWASTQKGE